jgi:hypothetical protein
MFLITQKRKQPEYNRIKIFDENYRQIRKKGIELPPEVLAFKLLYCARISETEQKLVKTGMNFEQRTKLYEQAEKGNVEIRVKYNVEQPNSAHSQEAVKREPAWITNQDSVVQEAYPVDRYPRRKPEWRNVDPAPYPVINGRTTTDE